MGLVLLNLWHGLRALKCPTYEVTGGSQDGSGWLPSMVLVFYVYWRHVVIVTLTTNLGIIEAGANPDKVWAVARVRPFVL